MSNDVSPVDSILFEEVCQMLEKLFKRNHKREQNNILIAFIDDIRSRISKIKDKKDANLFSLMRLLLPKLERERMAYNMKEAKLGQILVDVIPLSKFSLNGKKLLKWKSENSSKDFDFAREVYYILKNKARNSSNLTIGNINSMLDDIAANNVDNKKQTIHNTFTYALKNLNAEQLKWFVRIILKDLKCGIGDDRILAALHPDAPKLYDLNGSLSKVCEECDDGNNFMELGIKLLFPVKPMLSEKLDVTDVSQLSNDKTYQVEEKFDGERFQVHMEKGVFKYFSRRGYSSSSKNYGETYEEGLITPFLKDCLKTDVTSFILDGEMMGWHKKNQCFGSKAMEYDIKKVTEKSAFRPCFCAFDILYYNGEALIGLPEEGGKPLRYRLQLLDTLFTDKAGVIQHSKRQIVKQSSDILDALNKAMENREEGIVVKDTESYYLSNRRNDGWYKIKPELVLSIWTRYSFIHESLFVRDDRQVQVPTSQIIVDNDPESEISMNEIVKALKSMKSGKAAGYDRVSVEMLRAGQGIVACQLYHLFNLCWRSGHVPDDWCKAVMTRGQSLMDIQFQYTEGAMTELDLVIIGADKAENKRHGLAKSFLVACLDTTDSDDKERRWLCIGRVGIGLTNDQHEAICTALRLHWSQADNNNKPPPHLVFNKSKPDFWIEPKHSIVLQIRASELTRSPVFGTTHTLRFARVVRVREDKPVDDVMTLNDFNKLLENKGSVVKLNKERIDEEVMELGQAKGKISRKRTTKPAPQVAQRFKMMNHDDVEVTSKALLGRKVHILTDDDDCTRSDLVKIVKSHSGIFVTSSGSDTWCCIVGRMTEKVKKAIESQKYDIMTTSWLRSLPASESPCTLTPLDMLAITKTTKLNLARDYDDFGDSYTTPTDVNTLKRIFDRMDDDDIHLMTHEMLDLDAELFKETNCSRSPYSFLRSCSIHFVNCDDFNILLGKMYGASIHGDRVVNITHVVISNKASTEEINDVKRKYDDVLFVSESWLEACFCQKKYVPEVEFTI